MRQKSHENEKEMQDLQSLPTISENHLQPLFLQVV